MMEVRPQALGLSTSTAAVAKPSYGLWCPHLECLPWRPLWLPIPRVLFCKVGPCCDCLAELLQGTSWGRESECFGGTTVPPAVGGSSVLQVLGALSSWALEGFDWAEKQQMRASRSDSVPALSVEIWPPEPEEHIPCQEVSELKMRTWPWHPPRVLGWASSLGSTWCCLRGRGGAAHSVSFPGIWWFTHSISGWSTAQTLRSGNPHSKPSLAISNP